MELKSSNIEKSYKERRVVKGVDITVKSGEIVGLLGPNDAGTTVLQ
jgi:lipopolysaccharide export system ATP-binding protein